MPLTPGARLGAYEIVSLLGAGGMGEVYRARDTRLDRTVAVKVLPADVASTRELRDRFEREARTVAALNHPHICTLHDVGRHEDVDFLVMEYLEGETLEQRLERGALPLDHALQIAVQVADGLAAAHRAGVVHRDLKPGNIFLVGRPGEGRRGGASGPPLAKLLDFGLAKPAGPVSAGPASMLPTTPRGLTVQGTILGTFQYMAPEQLEGLDADARADIFAFGAVLYEMLTGRKAFEAKSHASLIAAILEHEPAPLPTVQPSVPPQVAHVVRRCLAKNPDERWQTAADLYRELKWAMEPPADAVPRAEVARTAPVPLWRRQVPLGPAIAMALVVGLLAGVVSWIIPRNEVTMIEPSVARLSITLPPGDEVSDPFGTAVTVSPDGTKVAYVASSGGREQLFLREVAAHEARSVGGTDGARSPFFSPDGQWVGFFAQGMLRKVSVSSGAVQTLTEAPYGVGGTWSEDGRVYFAATNSGGLSSVASDGGAALAVTQLDRAAGEVSHRWPHVLPGGRALMFEVRTGPGLDESRIDILRLDAEDRSVVVQGGTNGRYMPTGHVVYARRDELYALPFDMGRLQGSGQPVQLPDRPRYGGEGSQFAVSASGALAYVAGGPQREERRLAWVARDGSLDPVPAPPRQYFNVALSPDGRRAAVDVVAGTMEIWVYDFGRGTFTRLTTGSGSSQAPRWTHDGTRIAYRATRTGFRNVWWKTVGDTTAEERVTTSDNVQTPASWSANGEWLIYSENDPKNGADIWALSGSGDRKPRVVVRTAGFDTYPRLSPDSQWLAYASNESGRFEVFVQPFPGPGNRLQVSADGGSEPVWSRDGRELFYLNGNRMMAVGIRTGPSIAADVPRTLFTGRFVPSPNGVAAYDVAADGRFLMVQPLHPDPPRNQIQVVLNWFDELRRIGS